MHTPYVVVAMTAIAFDGFSGLAARVHFAPIISAASASRALWPADDESLIHVGRNGFKKEELSSLWLGESQATSEPTLAVLLIDGSGVMSTGRSRSLPLWKAAPARTRATSSGVLTLRGRRTIGGASWIRRRSCVHD